MSSADFGRNYTIICMCFVLSAASGARGAAVRRWTNKSAPCAAAPSGWCRFRVPRDCTWLAQRPRAPAGRRRCGASSATSASLAQATRDFNDRQSQIFVVIASFLLHYAPPDLHGVIDDDVAEAAAALASTFETASRGVIYEHRPASLPAERLATELRQVLDRGRQGRDLVVRPRRRRRAAAARGGGARRARVGPRQQPGVPRPAGRVLPKTTPARSPTAESGKLVSW